MAHVPLGWGLITVSVKDAQVEAGSGSDSRSGPARGYPHRGVCHWDTPSMTTMAGANCQPYWL